jgi:hypothetical protein
MEAPIGVLPSPAWSLQLVVDCDRAANMLARAFWNKGEICKSQYTDGAVYLLLIFLILSETLDWDIDRYYTRSTKAGMSDKQ